VLNGTQMDQVLNDSLLVFGSFAILLAPMALALANTGPGGAGWELLTFLCCTFAAWFFFSASSLLIPFVAWVLAWGCAMAMRISFDRRRVSLPAALDWLVLAVLNQSIEVGA
jgi:hypothetical protein